MKIDPRYRDHLGNYRPVVTYGIGDDNGYVVKGAKRAVAVSRQLFRQLGATEHASKVPDPIREPGDESVIRRFHQGDFYYDILGARHGAGTHIMGTTARNSVVDAFQRSHDHRNLFVVGCGSMPSIGTSNPTLTGAAMALRSADAVHKDLMQLHRSGAGVVGV